MSEMVNRAVRQAFSEDAENLAAFEERKEDRHIGYDTMVKKLGQDVKR